MRWMRGPPFFQVGSEEGWGGRGGKDDINVNYVIASCSRVGPSILPRGFFLFFALASVIGGESVSWGFSVHDKDQIVFI